MTLAECKTLEKGTTVHFKDYYGWWREGKFLRMVEVTKMGTMTAEDLFSKKENWVKKISNGRKTQEAVVEYLDDKGKTQWIYLSPRRLSLV